MLERRHLQPKMAVVVVIGVSQRLGAMSFSGQLLLLSGEAAVAMLCAVAGRTFVDRWEVEVNQ